MMNSRVKNTLRFCASAFFMDVAGGMFLVALPYMALSLGASSFDLGVLGAARGLPYVLACLSVAFFADRFSRRGLVIVSSVGLGAMLVGMAVSQSLWQLYLATIFFALSLSLYWPPFFAWLGDTHATRDLASASAAVNVSWSLGGMIGGVAGGALFQIRPSLPFLVAVAAIALSCGIVLAVPGARTQSEVAVRRTRKPGTRRGLAAVWLANSSAFMLTGLMTSVFPKFGEQLGVTAAWFGVFVAGQSLGRTGIFMLGIRWGTRLHGWGLAVGTQLVTAGMVATVSRAESHVWLALVFLIMGLNGGINYYRGLYTSLKAGGHRGFSTAMNEASVMGGMLVGSFGGGIVAKVWHLRAPYLLMAGLTVLLAAVQIVLIVSARGERGLSDRLAAPVFIREGGCDGDTCDSGQSE